MRSSASAFASKAPTSSNALSAAGSRLTADFEAREPKVGGDNVLGGRIVQFTGNTLALLLLEREQLFRKLGDLTLRFRHEVRKSFQRPLYLPGSHKCCDAARQKKECRRSRQLPQDTRNGRIDE